MSRKQLVLEYINNKEILHVAGCKNINRTSEIVEIKRVPSKSRYCKMCEKMIYILKGDKNAIKTKKKYESFFKNINIEYIKKFYTQGGKTKWWGDNLFIRFNNEDWKIVMDLSNPITLWHNNYKIKDNKRIFISGYHEQKIIKRTPESIFRTILWYRYEPKHHDNP